jgi:hypothetical protein
MARKPLQSSSDNAIPSIVVDGSLLFSVVVHPGCCVIDKADADT